MSLHIKVINEDNKKHAVLHDRLYDVKVESRGRKPKIWLVMDKSKNEHTPIKNRQMLCKLGRTNSSCDNWGEVFASHIGKQMGVDIVDYYMVDYEENKKHYNGVLCGSYFLADQQYEMSVKDLQTIYTPLKIDEKTLKTSKPINTVYSIMSDLDKIIDFPPEKKEFVMKSLKKKLLIQCLFDYILAQTDRHWLNTTFLIYDKNGSININKADCYDSGNIAFLQRKLVSLMGISREIGKDPLNSPLLKQKMEGYLPMMGIKTSTVNLTPASNGEVGNKMKVDISKKPAFINELTDEILHNPNLADFFIRFKNNFSMDKVLSAIKKEGDEPPQELVKLINDVISYQINDIDKVLKSKLKKIHEEDMEKY